MTAEILAMPGTTARDLPVDQQPVLELVELLEKLLDEAKSGNLRALAGAAVRVGDVTSTFWERPPDGAGGHDLMAAIGYLQHRYCASMCADSVAPESSGAG